MLAPIAALLAVGSLLVGGLVGYQALNDDESASSTVPASLPVTYAPEPTHAASPTVPLPTSNPTQSATPTGTTPEPTDTGPGSKTIVPELQAAADAAAGNRNVSLVALDMTNGEIVAVTGQQNAFSGATAPGSTFKIVTTAMLLTKGIVSENGKVPCPATSSVEGRSYHNVGNMAVPNATFRQDFARSCNTAFIDQHGKIGASDLSDFSRTYFGLNSNAWQLKPGLGSVDGVVPAAANENEKAEQMIGQGRLQMNALTMASVVATAVTGRFHQPIVERGGPVYSVKSSLPASVSRSIRNLMVECATNGTARDVFRGMSGVGAKTGTAEVGGGTDGWMVAYRGDIAVAAYVAGGSSGSEAAGPIVAQFLRAVPAK
jgi:cell division protein FtsI/penicillin-binding protein 2